jgi:hypothetical protein
MKSSLGNLLTILMLALCIGTGCPPAAAQNPTLVGSWPGYSRGGGWPGVAVSGDYAYTASYHGGMQILDVSDPAAPFPVGGYNPNGDLPYPNATADNVVVSGDFAYVVFGFRAGRKGLHVVDVSDPRHPVGKGKLFNGIACVDVAVTGDLAYVAAEDAGVLIANVSNPATPTEEGRYNTRGSARGVAASGQYAYVADGPAGLQVIGFNILGGAGLVGGIDTSGEAYDVAIEEQYAYVADGIGGLQIVDVSDPAEPVLAGRYNTSGEAYGVAVSGSLAYVADGASGLQIIDVSNPAAPSRVGGIGTPTHEEPNVPVGELKARNVGVAGNQAFVAHQSAGIDIIDVTDPDAPRRVFYYGSTQTTSLTVTGHHLYVADRRALNILDLTNPAVPTRIGGMNEGAADVTVAFGYAYVVPWSPRRGFLVLDVSNPALPESVGSYGAEAQFSQIRVHGQYAYTSSQTFDSEGLQIWHLANPAQPTLAGVYNTEGGGVGGLAFSGKLAFAAVRGVLHVIDVSNPATPERVGELITGTWPWEVLIVGTNHVCLNEYNGTSGEYGIRMVDVSDPGSPRIVKSLTFAEGVGGAHVVGDFLLLAGDFRVIDVSDPTMPVIRWTSRNVGDGEMVGLGDYVYVDDDYAGVTILRIPGLAALPTLEIARSGSGVKLSWPSSPVGFALETTPSLLPGTPWSPVTALPQSQGDRLTLTLDLDGDSAFYRLRKP